MKYTLAALFLFSTVIMGSVSWADVNFLSLPKLGEINKERVTKYLGMTWLEYEQIINEFDIRYKDLPDYELSGILEFFTLYEERTEFNGTDRILKKIRVQSEVPHLDGIIIYPAIGANGYDNFIPNLGPEPARILDVNFSKLTLGTKIHLKGKKSFLISDITDPENSRIYGESLFVTSADIDGKLFEMTARFDSSLPKKVPSDNPNDLFLLLGTPDKKRWRDPLHFFMDRTIRIRLDDQLQKRQILTAWKYPNMIRGKPSKSVSYKASIGRGNPWDPNWSFQFSSIVFEKNPPLTEICDGNLGQIESSYRSYRHRNVSPLDSFCPWGGANEIVEIQDYNGNALNDQEVNKILIELGGEIPEFTKAD